MLYRMLYRLLPGVLITLLTGCATHYGAYEPTKGGYQDQKIDDAMYVIRYIGAPYASRDELKPLWERRAQALCEGHELGKDWVVTRMPDPSGVGGVVGVVAGTAFCYGGFQDSRLQASDARFQPYQHLDLSKLAFKDLTPAANALLSEDFTYLESLIQQTESADLPSNDKQEKYDNQEKLKQLLRGISIARPDYGEPLKHWLQQRPDSYYALTANAMHQYNRAWLIQAREQEVPEGTFKQALQSSLTLSEKAIALRPQQPFATTVKMSILKSHPDYAEQAGPYFEQALEQFPHSHLVRGVYLASLSPQWGGSHDAMQSFIQDTQPLLTENSHLNRLMGGVERDKADQKMAEGDREAAITWYRKAIHKGSDSHAYRQLAGLLIANKQYVEARDLLEEAILLSPYDYRTYIGYAELEVFQGDPVSALTMVNIALYFAPEHDQLFLSKGKMLYAMRRYPAALESLQQAKQLVPENPLYEYWLRRTRFQIEIRQREPSEFDLKPQSKQPLQAI